MTQFKLNTLLETKSLWIEAKLWLNGTIPFGDYSWSGTEVWYTDSGHKHPCYITFKFDADALAFKFKYPNLIL